jgi:soluble lytic murein transglycosylase-like protein
VRADVYSHRDELGVEHYTNAKGKEGYTLLSALLQEESGTNRAQARPEVEKFDSVASQIESVAEEFQIDKALVHAVVTVESGYNAKAVSRAGAQGLMQLMPATAKRYAVKDVFDSMQNLRGGARYLRDLLVMFGGDMELAVAAYNAGEHAVLRYNRQVPPFRETLAYVPRVMALYRKLKAIM